MRPGNRIALSCLGLAISAAVTASAQRPWDQTNIASSHKLNVPGGVIQVDFVPGSFDLGDDAILNHVRMAANAVVTYYGRFPVARDRVLVVPVDGRAGVLQGTTWGDVGGWPAFTRIRIGQHTTADDLKDDWTMTHELTHGAFPSLPDDQHWMEEGLATYVEPIARVQAGELTAAQIWHDMLRDMGKGEPHDGDQGVDHTHTWGRTYWGGAMFCLVADVSIRRETKNKKGLQDALRAVVAAGLTIDRDRDISAALAIGDKATGTHVLTQLYADWKDKPVTVDLDKMWRDLGVSFDGDAVRFDDKAPLAAVRKAITTKRS
ncbi:MAG TPA: hypothetical protein VGJ21_06230 [Terracidiphilus sp.]|jgi:hypothetical protein